MNALTPASRLRQPTTIQQLAATMIDLLDRAESAGVVADNLTACSAERARADRERDERYWEAFELRRTILKLQPVDLTDASIQALALTLELDILNDDASSEPNIGRETFVNVQMGLLLTMRAAGADVPEALMRHFLTPDQAARLQAVGADQHAA
ncbi:hypothetical protein [Oceanibaculum indicum]|uniref:Uncharacterized protein n=1 Tax=Oceanibaculum indicum TaxID=526216 RepID=A0A420WR73_9PROT|nr:hypothetical protein [Oceanibaculum indicum]RKQ73479.1 hypothetical protein BCL74_1268 [Oceanibaculum indicum]